MAALLTKSDLGELSMLRHFRPCRLLTSFLACFAILLVLMLAVNSIPRSLIQKQLHESGEQLSWEGLYPRMMGDSRPWELDNFTTAIMLNITAHSSEAGLNGVLAAYNYGADGSDDQIANFNQGIDETVLAGSGEWHSYARYWHGYTVVLKPLLLILNLYQIRMLFFIVMFGLIVALCIALSRAGAISAFGTALAFALACFPAASFSLSLAFSITIALSAAVYVAWVALASSGKPSFANECHKWLRFYLIVGMLTSFFDFLCTPALTLGLPMAVMIFFGAGEVAKMGFGNILKLLFGCCLAWLLGYGGLWMAKWVLTDLVNPGLHVLENAFGAVAFRSSDIVGYDGSGEEIAISAFDAMIQNFELMFPKWIIFAFCAVLLIFVLGIATGKVSFRNEVAKPTVALIAIMLFPYFWYIALSNHSYIHCWFTYRLQIMTVVSASLLLSLNFRGFPISREVE